MRFDAPWSTALRWITVGVSGVLALAALGLGRGAPPFASLPLLFVLGGLLFTVRGYRLEPGRLLVERLLWTTVVPLEELREAWHDPAAMRGSLRLFGNGGLFVFAGLFHNKTLGRYRALATDPARSVVLVFPNRKLVVTPDRPEAFLSRLRVDGPRFDRLELLPPG